MSPIVLLLLSGLLLGAMTPLARAAVEGGVPPAVFVFWVSLGAGSILGLIGLVRGQPLRRRHLRYSVLAAVVSLSLPHLLVALVVTRLGAGLTALMYTLPPLFTMGLSAVVGVERLSPRRTAGVLLGLAGAVTLVAARYGLDGAAGDAAWMALALLIPVCLAIGNVYRTKAWPQGASPLTLAGGMLLASALWVLPLAAWQGLAAGADHWAVPVMAALTGLTYVFFFALQKAAGPVYLSQIGYVAAPVGMAAGIAVFGERPGLGAVLGIVLIAAGILIGNRRPGQVRAPVGES